LCSRVMDAIELKDSLLLGSFIIMASAIVQRENFKRKQTIDRCGEEKEKQRFSLDFAVCKFDCRLSAQWSY
jgi:hypothetical protein